METVDLEPEDMLAELLNESVVFINNGWWEPTWPKDSITVHVNCNDIFAWGCSDAEDLPFSELPIVYAAWKKDAHWGPALWCIKRRKMAPQAPVAKALCEAGYSEKDFSVDV